MDTEHNISIENHPRTEDVQFIREELAVFNRIFAPEDRHQQLTVFLRDKSGSIIGGLLGGTYWRWLYIEVLWVAVEFRKQGYGAALLSAAENEAIKRGCHYSHLDTHSFQAVSFYERRGYSRVGELKDLPEGHSRYLLWKSFRQTA